MSDPQSYRPGPGEIPTEPGVYRFRDSHRRVVYVGKAKNLRSRLANYFQDLATLHPRTQQMVTTATSVEWTVVRTEVEAFALEYSWIKEYDPRFNVKYRDDKSYPYLAVTMGDEFPRIQVVRGTKRKGTRYFGPYAHAWAIRETVDLLLRVFPVRTCSTGVFRSAERSGRPCLLGYIDKCSAPCVGRVGPEEHRSLAEDFCEFMGGDSVRFTKRLNAEMRQASQDLDFERAARLRDDIEALTRAMEKNTVVFSESTDADVFGIAQDELEASAQVFHVRGGRIRGQRGWIVEKVEDLSDGELVEHLLQQVYGELDSSPAGSLPTEILVPFQPAGPERVSAWLRGLRGAKVDIRVPQRGEKKSLAETVERNAQQALQLHKLRRSSDLTTRSQAMREIQDALGLEEAPLRIECYDISNLQQTNIVASMVVFEDGLAKKSDYRRFIMTGKETDGATDDTAAVYEVITRRFRNYLDEQREDSEPEFALDPGEKAVESAVPAAAPASATDEAEVPVVETKKRFAYPPNLVVVDGGLPQVNAAAQALADLGVDDVALCGLAKRLEEVWLPGDDYPVILPRTSQGLYLLQRVRDEAHRFAITFHRERRSKSMTVSALDGISGLGPARQKALLKQFGSVRALRTATAEELATAPGIGPALAETVALALSREGTTPAINTATGEILDS